ncbi:MAG: hypothetical protein AB7G13_22145 [Lautropia sp.]
MIFKELKPGQRLSLGDAELMVIRAPAGSQLDLDVGSQAGGTLLGKRYVSQEHGLELLCVKSGAGPVLCDGKSLPYAATKSLPSSD